MNITAFGCTTKAQMERHAKWIEMIETWEITSVRRSWCGAIVNGKNFTGTVQFRMRLLPSFRLWKGRKIRIQEGENKAFHGDENAQDLEHDTK